MVDIENRVALVTGANSGVGFSLVRRLLLQQFHGLSTNVNGNDHYPSRLNSRSTTSSNSKNQVKYKIILGCRNFKKANEALKELKKEFPNADLEIVQVDVSVVESVKSAANEIMKRFPPLTHLFLNAGIMPITGLNWNAIAKDMVLRPYDLFSTGRNAFTQETGKLSKEGYGEVFAANVLGHLGLIQYLQPHFSKIETRIIWTSSITASADAFKISDIECKNGDNPYHSSKYLMDILTVYLNEKYGSKNVHVFSTCPGSVATNIISIPLPFIVLMGCFYFFRVFVPNLTTTAHNGSLSLFHVGTTDLGHLSKNSKYMSRSGPLGKGYLELRRIAEGEEWEDVKEKARAAGRLVERYL
ncbi:hypothetical protein BKA69DRAFT_1091533 [Paraphysoderma sedebokerense]|nr:hypothetical protein BKA69DRAFT_1091533 [Paraphysoderma sedebokerense]